MRGYSYLLAGVLTLGASAAVGQTAMSPAAPAVTGMTGGSILRVGTEVPLRLVEQLTTEHKQLRVGQRFHLEVAEAVIVQGLVVIPVGSPAVGEITEVRNKGMWGKSGHLGARLLYVTANGRQIKLNGTFDDKGTAGGWGAAATSAIVFLPAGFFMTGTSARVPAGAAVKGFIDEDVPFMTAAPAPMMVSIAPVATSSPVVTTPKH